MFTRERKRKSISALSGSKLSAEWAPFGLWYHQLRPSHGLSGSGSVSGFLFKNVMLASDVLFLLTTLSPGNHSSSVSRINVPLGVGEGTVGRYGRCWEIGRSVGCPRADIDALG